MHHRYSHSIPYGSNNLGSFRKTTNNFDGFFQTFEHDKKGNQIKNEIPYLLFFERNFEKIIFILCFFTSTFLFHHSHISTK